VSRVLSTGYTHGHKQCESVLKSACTCYGSWINQKTQTNSPKPLVIFI